MSTSNGAKQALHVATMSGWYRFEQDSCEWKQVKRWLTYWNLTCLTVDLEHPQWIYAGTEHSGLFLTRNAGACWMRANPNTPRMMLFSVLALDGHVMVGTVPSAVYRSKTDGGGWEELEGVRANSAEADFPPSPELQSRTRYLAYDPFDRQRIYAGIEVGGLLVTNDGGRSWQPANEGLRDPDVHEVYPSAARKGVVFAACGEGVFRSFDRGARWEEITPSSHDYGMSVVEDASGTLYLGTARGRPNTWLREEGADAAILRSRDSGTRWEVAIDRLQGGVMNMCQAPSGSGIIAGTSDGTLLAVDDSGVRVIANGLPGITAVKLGA